jgi:hypothetical protein
LHICIHPYIDPPNLFCWHLHVYDRRRIALVFVVSMRLSARSLTTKWLSAVKKRKTVVVFKQIIKLHHDYHIHKAASLLQTGKRARLP